MIRGLLYKEWIKTRWLIVFSLCIGGLVLLFNYSEVKFQYIEKQPINYFLKIMVINLPYLSMMKFLPAFFGMLLAMFQFIPEINNKKYKLMFGLPLNENKISLMIMNYGLLVVIIYALFISFGSWLLSIKFLYPEVVFLNFSLLLTWQLAGLIMYLGVSTVLCEPNWAMKLFFGFIVFISIKLALDARNSGTTDILNFYLFGSVICSFMLLFYALTRLRKGQ